MRKNLSFVKKSELFKLKGVFTTRSVAVMGTMLALAVILQMFTIYITDTFKGITFAYLPGVFVSMLFGPWAAIPYGFAVDTLKFITNSRGGYFFGYAISEMVMNFIYAIVLYKRPISVWRVTVARLAVLIIVTLGLDYIWLSMMSGEAASAYFTGIKMINRIVQFPFHVALITVLGKIVYKIKLEKFS